jgi:hypothetical protein
MREHAGFFIARWLPSWAVIGRQQTAIGFHGRLALRLL